MTETNSEDVYARRITATINEPGDDTDYAHNIDSAGNQGTISAHDGTEVYQEPRVDSIYLEIQDPHATPDPIADQRLQTAASPVPHTLPQNQNTNSYPQTTWPPTAINQGYIPEQPPPSYNEAVAKGQPGFNVGPHVHQPQPWGQQFHPNYHSNVVVTTQPQHTPPNMVFVNSAPQRNPSQGLATASLVMAIVGIFCCFCSIFCTVPAIVFAAISLGSTTDLERARTHANISMICTVIGWISGVIIWILYIVLVIAAS